MELITERTPLDLTIHLGTEGCPVSLREMVQQVAVSGAERMPVGTPTIEGGEYRGDQIAAIIGQAIVAAQAQAAASERRAAEETARAEAAERLAAERLADAESLRGELGEAMTTIRTQADYLALRTQALAEAQAEIASLRAAKASDSVGPA